MTRRSHGVKQTTAYATGLAVLVCAVAGGVAAQDRASDATEPVFDVVSIKRNTTKGPYGRPMNSSLRRRPDGGMTMISVPVGLIITRAYDLPFRYVVGLPEWATTDHYDVSATSTLDVATPAQHRAMLRAMLADRFRLAVHRERRIEDAYDLVLARADGRLGPGLTKIDADCASQEEARRVALAAADETGEPPAFLAEMRPDQAPPPCRIRARTSNPQAPDYRGDVLEGEGTIAELVNMLRLSTRGPVVDRTGLPGSYRVSMTYSIIALQRGPDVAPAFDAPTVFTAVTEHLGLRLQRTKAESGILVVDRIERPSEN